MKEKTIVIHCSATPPSMDIGVKQIDEWHRARGWAGCGYHFVIRRTGILEYGRHLNRTGAHVKGFNKDSIGICLVGGITPRKFPEPNYTIAQWRELSMLVEALKRDRVIGNVVGHRDLAQNPKTGAFAKDCPCFEVLHWAYRGYPPNGDWI